jgi:hypothetical protein
MSKTNLSRLETTSAPSTKKVPLAPCGTQPPHQVHTTPSGGASGTYPHSLTPNDAWRIYFLAGEKR